MTSTQPRYAVIGGVIVAAVFALASAGLIVAGPETAMWGVYLLLALPVAAGVVTGWYLHAVDAMLLTAFLAAVAFFAIGLGLDVIRGLVYFLPPLFIGTLVGPVVGFLTRRLVRR
jgi:hypothetical protein